MLENVVLFPVDGEKGEGKDIAEEYRLQGFPTFVFADAAGAVMNTWAGYGKSSFLESMENTLADPTTVDEKRARFEAGPTAGDAATLAQVHATRGEHADAIAMFEKAAELDPASDYAWDLLDATFYAVRAEASTVEDMKKRADGLFAGADRDPLHLGYAIQMLQMVGRKAEQPGLATPYLKTAIDAASASDDPQVVGMRANLEVEYAVLVEKDLDRATTLKRATYPEGWKDSPAQLNSFAWWCFEQDFNLEEAEALARRGVELSPAGPDRGNLLDTAAEICNARGNCDDAVELMQQAMADDPEKEYFRKQLERFEKIRAESVN